MPFATIDGIRTRYEAEGAGPPLLMFSPGGFDATIEKWSNLGIYAKTRPLDYLRENFTCIMFDRRECGQSGGRIERVRWRDFALQGKALLDHLGIARCHLMGGCMGVSPALQFATLFPQSAISMVLYWPVGGPRYRISSQQRFAEHLAFVSEKGMEDVCRLVRETGKTFGADPRGGPWASTIKAYPDFAEAFAGFDLDAYKLICAGMARGLVDRDSAPGAEPEDLLRCALPALIVPGSDTSHATSAARYLGECLPRSIYWDRASEAQTRDLTREILLQFLRDAA